MKKRFEKECSTEHEAVEIVPEKERTPGGGLMEKSERSVKQNLGT